MKYCPHCGAELEPGAKFCTKCGFRLDEEKSSSEQPASWIKAEQRSGRKRNQDTMVFNQNPDQQNGRKGQRQDQQTPPPQNPVPTEEEEKKKRTNSILTGVLIGLLVVAIAVGGFFIWRNRRQNQNDSWKRSQNTTQSSENGLNGTPAPGDVNILEPSANVSESRERARRDNYSGLVNDSGRTSYVTSGQKDRGFTGIVTDDSGKKYFVVNGQVRYGFSGDVTEDGEQYTILNGQVVDEPEETTTTNEDDQGVDTTEYNETDETNGAQKFNDFEAGKQDDGTYINPNPPEMEEGKVSYGIDSVAYDDDQNYVVTFVIINGTDHNIKVKEIDNIQLRDGGEQTLATGKVDDLEEPIEVDADSSQTISFTLVNEKHGDDDLSKASIMADLVQE